MDSVLVPLPRKPACAPVSSAFLFYLFAQGSFLTIFFCKQCKIAQIRLDLFEDARVFIIQRRTAQERSFSCASIALCRKKWSIFSSPKSRIPSGNVKTQNWLLVKAQLYLIWWGIPEISLRRMTGSTFFLVFLQEKKKDAQFLREWHSVTAKKNKREYYFLLFWVSHDLEQ